MPDIVVTVPRSLGLARWIAEGQLPGEEWNGLEYHFYLGGYPPDIKPGERVYVVYNNRLRGYAPLVRIDSYGRSYGLVRHGGAVAMTIEEEIKGFRGFRYRWWQRAQEILFPAWQQEVVIIARET